MVKTIIIDRTGAPEVLTIKDIPLKQLEEGEVRIKHSTIGLNFIDIETRRGDKGKDINLPAILGYEACGIIEETKGNVGELKIGDRVAYATAPMGTYCEARNLHHKYLVGVPEYISDEQASACLFKGMTAHYLTKRTFFVKKGMYILIHAASGGVGMYLTKMCKEVGAIVIGCVGYDEKIAVAKSNGCDYVINYLNEDFHKMVMDITKNKGVNAVYDSIGKNTFLKSIMCLSNYGIMVSYGTSSGPILPFDINYLREKNIFLTSPSIFKYKENRYELIFSSSEIWTMLQKNIITDNINMKYKFEDIQTAHKDIQNRATVGSNIIVL